MRDEFWNHLLKKNCVCLFLERGSGRERRETSICGCLSCATYRRPGLQPRHVPWLGIEPETLWFAGLHSIHWIKPARARNYLFIYFFTNTGNALLVGLISIMSKLSSMRCINKSQIYRSLSVYVCMYMCVYVYVYVLYLYFAQL